MVNFGEKLKKLRIQNRLTQKQVSERVGVAVSAISGYETGNREPSFDTLIKLVRIYHISTDYLLGLEEREVVDISGLNDNKKEIIINLVNILSEKK